MGNRNGKVYRKEAKPGVQAFVKTEVFKWSSQEFLAEYAVIYTSNSNDASSCVLRVSANPDKARLKLHDTLCFNEDMLMNMEVKAVRDESTGKYKLALERFDCNMDMETKGETDNGRWRVLQYSCKVREVQMVVRDLRLSSSHSSSPQDKVVVSHFLSGPSEENWLQLLVGFKCHWYKGLQVELSGPSINGQLRIDRMVEEDPEDCSNYSVVKTECMFPSKKPKDAAAASSLLATGAINNVNAVTQDIRKIFSVHTKYWKSNMGNRIYARSNPAVFNIHPTSTKTTYHSEGHVSIEQSIQYTAGSGDGTCTLLITSYLDNEDIDCLSKASVELLDVYDGEETRAAVCVGTHEVHNDGSRMMGSAETSYQGNVAVMNHNAENNKVSLSSLSYGSSRREGLMIIARREEALKIVTHNYWCINNIAKCVTVELEIKIDRRTGLLVKYYGPFQTDKNLHAMQALHSKRIGIMREGLDYLNSNTCQLLSALHALRGLTDNLGWP